MLLLWYFFFYSSWSSLIKRETAPKKVHVSACLLCTWAQKRAFCTFYSLNLYNGRSKLRTNVKAQTKKTCAVFPSIKFLQNYKDIQGYSISGDFTKISYIELNYGQPFLAALACWSCSFNHWRLGFVPYSEARKFASLFFWQSKACLSFKQRWLPWKEAFPKKVFRGRGSLTAYRPVQVDRCVHTTFFPR